MQTDQIRLRLDSDFKSEIFEMAKDRKMSASQLIRTLLFNELQKKSQSN